MKKKIVVFALTVMLALGAGFAMVGCGGNSHVVEIKTSKQTSGSVVMTNYQIVIKGDTQWVGMADAEKQKIIDYGWKESMKLAEENSVVNFNVIAVSENGDVLFMLNRAENNIIIYEDAQPVATVDVPA